MNRKTLAILAIAVALAALLLLRPGREADLPPAAPGAPAEATAPGAMPPAPAGEPETAPPPEEPDPTVPPADHVTWEGTVVVTDAHGVRHPSEDGEIRLWSVFDGRRVLTPVAVRGGRFSLPAPGEVEWTVDGARLGGRAAAATGEEVTVQDGRRLSVELRWPRPLVFRVVDAETGVELTGVTVLRVEDWQRGRYDLPPPPRPKEIVVTRAASPVTVPIAAGDEVARDRIFFVRAEGYAWRSIHADTSEGGDRLVPLSRGGALDLRVEGGTREEGLRIRFYPADRVVFEPTLEIDPGEATEFALPGLPAGRWTVRAELGAAHGEARVLAETIADVSAGGRTVATLTLPELEALEPAAVTGTLFLAPGWLEDSPRLTLAFRGAARAGLTTEVEIEGAKLAPVHGTPGRFRFEAEGLQPGDWVATVDSFAFVQSFSLAPGERVELRLELPPPATLAIRTLDAATGKPAPVTSLGLQWGGAADHRGHLSLSSGEERGSFHAFVAPGAYTILVFEDGYEYTSRDVTVGPEGADVEIRLSPAIMLGIELRDGTARVPWPEDWGFPEVEALGGTGAAHGMSFTEDRTELQFNAPGRYRLTFEALDGFEPIPPQEVDVTRAGPNELTIRLERKR